MFHRKVPGHFYFKYYTSLGKQQLATVAIIPLPQGVINNRFTNEVG